MNSEEAGELIIKNLKNWSKENPRLTVAIDGIPGVGKTTVLNYIVEKFPKVEPIHIDEFLSDIDFRNEHIAKLDDPIPFFRKSFFDYHHLRELIETYKLGKSAEYKTMVYQKGHRTIPKTYDLIKPILVLEGILLFDPNLLNDLWDKRIFLDGDEQKIKERRVAREKMRWGETYQPEDDPNSWFRFILGGIKQYEKEYGAKGAADLVIEIT